MKKPASSVTTWLKQAELEQNKHLTEVVYAVFACKVHSITIHYIKGFQTIEGESPCWDCFRDANLKRK